MKALAAMRAWLSGAGLSLIFMLLPILLLLYIGYSLPQQLNRLQQEFQNRLKYDEVSADIYNLTNNVQEYILYRDPQSLSNIQRYSSEAIKKELGLYNSVRQSQKQSLMELISLNEAYNTFVKQEVIPSVPSFADKNRDILLWQYRDLSRQLVYKAQMLTEINGQESKGSLDRFSSLMAKEQFFALFIFLFALGSLLLGGLVVRPWLVRYFYLTNLIKDSPYAIMFIDRKERLRYLNNYAENIFQLPKKVVERKNLDEILTLYPCLQNVMQPLYGALLQNEKITNYRLNYNRGEVKLPLSVDCIPIRSLNKPLGAVLVMREETRLADSNMLLDTVERERKHLAIEIHDWIGRYLSSIIHGLDFALRKNENHLRPEARESLLTLRTQCQNAAIDMRSIMNDIHPYIVEKVGLIPALESYCTNFERVHGKKVYMFYQHHSLNLTRKEEISVYRIIQEALTNSAKHSIASEVDIHFTETDGTLRIEILDNGDIKETTLAPGKGLWGMKERAKLIGGELTYGFKDSGFYINLTLQTGGAEASEKDRDYAGRRP